MPWMTVRVGTVLAAMMMVFGTTVSTRAGAPQVDGVWQALGAGTGGNGVINAMIDRIAVAGDDVYIAGGFKNIFGDPRADYVAHWNGASWSSMGGSGSIAALNDSAHDIAIMDGDVYVAGSFQDVAGIPTADAIARWDGSAWHAIGSDGAGDGMFADGIIDALLVHDGILYAASRRPDYIFAWDGSAWSNVGSTAGGYTNAIAWWDGSVVTGGEQGLDVAGEVRDLAVRALAVGPGGLYVGGEFRNAGGVEAADYLARWDGEAWFAVGPIDSATSAFSYSVFSLSVVDGVLFAGGQFRDAAGLANGDSLVAWDGVAWKAVAPRGPSRGAFEELMYIEDIASRPDGIVVAGGFSDAGGNAAADAVAILSFQTDTTPPDATLALNAGAISTTSRDVTATLAASDADSGVSDFRLRDAGGDWSAWTEWPDGEPTSADAAWQLPAGAGPHAVEAQVRDAAGNVSLVVGAAIELDPSVASEFVAVSIAAGAEYTGSRSVVLDLFAPAGIARIKVANDSGGLASAPWEPYVAHRAWTLGDPNGEIVTKNVYVRFSSGPGDTGETASDDIVIDPLPPGAGPAALRAAAVAPDALDPAAVSTVTLDTRARDQAGGSGVTAMQLSTSSSFSGAVWEPFTASRGMPVESRAATTIRWRFRDAAGNVSAAVTRKVADPASPSVPTQVAPFHATTALSRRPTVRWLPVGGSGSYRIQVDQTADFASPVLDTTTTSTSLRPSSALPAGAALVWRVRRGTGAWSPAWTFVVPAADPPALASPAAGATVTSLSPRLAWKAVPRADRYTVQVSADAAFLVGEASKQTAATRLDLPSLARRATLHWRVRARVGGEWGAWSAARSLRTPTVGVPSPVAPAARADVNLPVTLDWTDVPGGASYRVQVCSTSACGTTERNAESPTSAYRLTGSLASGVHWWRVRAVAADGSKGAWSKPRAFVR